MKGADHIVKLERAILVEYSAGRKDTLSRQDVGFILSPERRMIPTRSSFEEARYPVCGVFRPIGFGGKSITETISAAEPT